MVQYGSDLCTAGQAIIYPADANGRQIICGPFPDWHITYAGNAFNDQVISSITCGNLATKGFRGKDYTTHYLGQDFGSQKHIRKIRYQYFDNIGNVTIRASNSETPFSSYTNILTNQALELEDTGWNELLLPSTQSYRYWYLVMSGGVAPVWGEIEMMEAILRPHSLAYIL